MEAQLTFNHKILQFVFRLNNREKCPQGWGLAVFIGSGVEVLNSFFPGVGEFAHQTENCPGGWSGFELTDTLIKVGYYCKLCKLSADNLTFFIFLWMTLHV